MAALGSTATGRISTALDVLRSCADPPEVLSVAAADRVASALRRAVPELAGGTLRLTACEAGDVRFRRGSWHVRYTVTVADESGSPRGLDLLGVLPAAPAAPPPSNAAFGSPDWSVRLADPPMSVQRDPRQPLPALGLLTDAAAMRSLLEEALGAAAFPGLRIAGAEVEVARDVPGQRCTVVCRLRYPAGADPRWPAVVVAKTYRGDEGAQTYDAMRALWSTPLSAGPRPSVAEPLAYLPAQRILVQRGLAGDTTLKDLVRAAEAEPSGHDAARVAMTRTADTLAALHASDVRSGPERRWSDDLARLHKGVARVSETSPPVAAALGSLAQWLAEREAAAAAEELRPSHGAFRPAQVIVHDSGVGFVDFDGFCRSEPARDVARFRKALHKASPASASPPGLADLFLARYEEQAALSRERVALWECLHLLQAMTHGWLSGRGADLPPLVGLLERSLAPLR